MKVINALRTIRIKAENVKIDLSKFDKAIFLLIIYMEQKILIKK